MKQIYSFRSLVPPFFLSWFIDINRKTAQLSKTVFFLHEKLIDTAQDSGIVYAPIPSGSCSCGGSSYVLGSSCSLRAAPIHWQRNPGLSLLQNLFTAAGLQIQTLHHPMDLIRQPLYIHPSIHTHTHTHTHTYIFNLISILANWFLLSKRCMKLGTSQKGSIISVSYQLYELSSLHNS